MLQDEHQREIATDPHQSFIVEAPAGSGKTEILTQRFLRLLNQVQDPEQIIALTFTRKAANEMRERILSALQQTQSGVEALSDHQVRTHSYAKQALLWDKTQGWQLLQNAHRLRIMTIDSLCQMIAQAIPIHSNHFAKVTEFPQSFYLNAVRTFIQSTQDDPPFKPALKILLHHVDNRQEVLVALFIDMLAKRDQWLTPLLIGRQQNQAQFEQALAWIEAHELQRFQQTISQTLQEEMYELVTCLVMNIDLEIGAYACLRQWKCFADLNAEIAGALAQIFLTSTGQLRKSFDHHIGLKRDTCPDPIYGHIKAHSKDFIEKLQTCPDFQMALTSIRRLPKPQFHPQQWEVLQALFQLLPVLVGHLTLTFQDAEAIDFTGIAHQARLALGHQDAPSDLALYLDHQIQHLLIDEFQDTSLQQFELISQLLHGWEPDDGRTLFVVGDPMQSIYRFRAAEVGLFLRAKKNGIGPVALQVLQLNSNFRSTPTLVKWVNHHFQTIFPADDDIESGAVSFHSSTAIRPHDLGSFVHGFQYADAQAEAQGMINIIKEELAQPIESIAVLVRSRAQLHALIPLLHQENIPFQGIDIHPLHHLPHIKDVWSLTQAYLMPAQRLAWLAFLRSPWCGLALSDLLVLSQYDQSIFIALTEAGKITELSTEGQLRAQYIAAVFQQAFAVRQQQSLVDSLRDILRHLHIHSILTSTQQADLEQYWSLLAQFEINGQLPDLTLFREHMSHLYSNPATPSRLQIMTIHKSKGLEFDVVLLPGLGSKTQNHDQALLRWLQLPSHDQEEIFLISPLKSAAEDHCLLYDYLTQLDTQKYFYESQRLLYVAVTRAKQRLYLGDHQTTLHQKSFRQMLTRVDPLLFEQSIPSLSSAPEAVIDEAPDTAHNLQRLPLSFYQDAPQLLPTLSTSNIMTLPNTLPRLIGIVTHTLLQWICTHHPQSRQEIPWSLAKDHLLMLGFGEVTLKLAMEQILEQIEGFLNDPTGQWIAQPHPHEQNEYEILLEQGTQTRILDRTFIDHHTRWIIDFKTGQFENDTIKQYQAQLNHYAELFREIPRLPIRCGLYYLKTFQWIEWEPNPCTI